jgi:TolB-like protein
MLTTDLAASHSIAVVERTKLAALRQEMKLSRSAAADPATALRLGKLASATHVVTGTFTLVGKELRLDARAVEIATGRVVLATDAKGERDAFFELEKKLANAIVSGIGVTLSPKERASFARIQTADFEAFRRFGDGLRLFDDADYDKSLEALRDATARDQEFKLAATTLETYQRMASEIRGRADVIEAEKRVKSAEARRQLRADEQALIDRLMAVAARKGAAARQQRVAALYLAIRILTDGMDDEGLDRFARSRLRDALVTRYVREADGLFPDLPMVPFQPMGERWGGPEAPKSPAGVDRAIAAAIDRFARYGQNPVKDAQEIRHDKEEHLDSIFLRTFKDTAAAMHLDYRAATDLLDRFYATGARFSPSGRWRTRALEERAIRRRWQLDIDASTRLFKEASTVETNPTALRKLAEQVESNAGIAEVLGSGRPDPCLREWVLSVLSQDASTVRRRMQQDAKLASLCTSDYVKTDRRRMNSGDMLDTVPVWIWGPSNGRPSFGGPQTEPGRYADLRFLGKDRDRNGRAPWMVAIVEGVPRAGAALALELHYDLPPDAPCRPGSDCPAPAEHPTVTVFFDAGNVEVRAPRHGNGARDDVPMEATGVAIGGGLARRVDLRVLLDSERYDTTGPSATERSQAPLPLPATGAVPITVRREDRRLVVLAAGREVALDAPPAAGGFLGFLVEGHGFVRIGGVRIRPPK